MASNLLGFGQVAWPDAPPR